jgi:hypothetical protein
MIIPLAFKKKNKKSAHPRTSEHEGTEMDAFIHSVGRRMLHRASIKPPLA